MIARIYIILICYFTLFAFITMDRLYPPSEEEEFYTLTFDTNNSILYSLSTGPVFNLLLLMSLTLFSNAYAFKYILKEYIEKTTLNKSAIQKRIKSFYLFVMITIVVLTTNILTINSSIYELTPKNNLNNLLFIVSTIILTLLTYRYCNESKLRIRNIFKNISTATFTSFLLFAFAWIDLIKILTVVLFTAITGNDVYPQCNPMHASCPTEKITFF